MRGVSGAFLTFLFFSVTVHAGDEIQLKVYPQVVSSINGTVRIDYRIPRNPDNRSYSIVVRDDVSEIAVHEASLDGEYEKVVFNPIWIDHLEAGNYKVIGTLVRNQDGKEKEYYATETFTVH